MSISGLILGLIFVLGIPYLIMGLLAYAHIEKNDNGTQMLALSPSWAINEKIYNETGKKLCVIGRRLFWLNIVLGLAWVISSFFEKTYFFA